MATETRPPSVETAKVAGRRELHFDDLDAVLADAENLARRGYQRLGNWSLGQICMHLALAMKAGIDGAEARAPWPIRWLASRFFKDKTLAKMKAGFQLPKKSAVYMVPRATADQEGLAELRRVIERWRKETRRHPHAFFGKLTPLEWDRLSLSHAELHLSFLVPQGEESLLRG